ncbi:hypothetical protein Leryth_020856 [Lithospermum erythrorhizon]|nr:hypothetical protein Leryth_020856 [Lithospermum erythrorhizon]
MQLFTKPACIHLLKSCKTINQVQQIHAQIITRGHHHNIDTLQKLIFITTQTSYDNLYYAETIFYQIKQPTLFVFNVLIKGHVKKGNFFSAFYLFDEMRVRNIWPDNFTFPFVCKAVVGLKRVWLGERIHGFVLKCGLVFDCYVCNSIMDMYGELGCFESLKCVFEGMSRRDLVSWNVLISGLVKCGKFEDAIGVYRRLRGEADLRPSEATVVSTLSACIAAKDLEVGKEIHDYVRNELGFTIIIANALLDMYCKCGCSSIAREIFDTIPRKNVISWTSMVSGYVNCGKLDEARELFDRSSVCDLFLWTAMINGYVQMNRVDEAMTLFRNMLIKGVRPDKFTLVPLLTGCARLGVLEDGEWIHNYIVKKRIPIDAVVGTALMEMYAKCGRTEKSLEIFMGLKEKDTRSWTSMICNMAMSGNASTALRLFSEMEQAGCRPDEITFIGVLSACSHGGLVNEGRHHFDAMIKVYQIQPKHEHYTCMIDLLGRSGLLDEAEEMIETIPIKDSKIIVQLYASLLSSCRIHGNVDMGERIAKLLMEIELSDSSVHSLLADIYASANRWDDLIRVRKKMNTLPIKKPAGCSSVEINRQFYTK